jgi:hypothetical protein
MKILNRLTVTAYLLFLAWMVFVLVMKYVHTGNKFSLVAAVIFLAMAVGALVGPTMKDWVWQRRKSEAVRE